MFITKEQWEKDYVSRIPDSQKGVFKRAYSGKSKPSAVKAKCLDCTNFQRQEVELCETTTCPLYQYRPYKGRELKPSINILIEKKERPKRVLTATQKELMAKGREKSRQISP